MEMAGMAFAVDNWPDSVRDSAIGTALIKIKESCIRQCDGEQLIHLHKITNAINNVFSEPSLERGMIQGDFAGIMDRLSDELDNDPE